MYGAAMRKENRPGGSGRKLHKGRPSLRGLRKVRDGRSNHFLWASEEGEVIPAETKIA